MGKNIVFLGLLIWAANSMAETKVVQPELTDVDTYKVEKPVPEKEGRSLAGIKKKQQQEDVKTPDSESDSEVRYWQYQE